MHVEGVEVLNAVPLPASQSLENALVRVLCGLNAKNGNVQSPKSKVGEGNNGLSH